MNVGILLVIKRRLHIYMQQRVKLFMYLYLDERHQLDEADAPKINSWLMVTRKKVYVLLHISFKIRYRDDWDVMTTRLFSPTLVQGKKRGNGKFFRRDVGGAWRVAVEGGVYEYLWSIVSSKEKKSAPKRGSESQVFYQLSRADARSSSSI